MAKEITSYDVEQAWRLHSGNVDYWQWQFLHGKITQREMHKKMNASAEKCEALDRKYLEQ